MTATIRITFGKEKNEHNQTLHQLLGKTVCQCWGKWQRTPNTTFTISFPLDIISWANLTRKALGFSVTSVALHSSLPSDVLALDFVWLHLEFIWWWITSTNVRRHLIAITLDCLACAVRQKHADLYQGNAIMDLGKRAQTRVFVTATNISELHPSFPFLMKKCITWLDKTGRKMRCQHTKAEHPFCRWVTQSIWSRYVCCSQSELNSDLMTLVIYNTFQLLPAYPSTWCQLGSTPSATENPNRLNVFSAHFNPSLHRQVLLRMFKWVHFANWLYQIIPCCIFSLLHCCSR